MQDMLPPQDTILIYLYFYSHSMWLSMTDTISFDHAWFDGDLYVHKQQEAIRTRLQHCDSTLYLEIGGKFLHDPHASRVLPGYHIDSKARIFAGLPDAAVIFCLNAKDIVRDRQFTDKGEKYTKYVLKQLQLIQDTINIQPIISVNFLTPSFIPPDARSFMDILSQKGYTILHRYIIDEYPQDLDSILSDQWFGRDQYHTGDASLVYVTGPWSNSGKLSTALGHVYHDHTQGKQSWYAKFETFPIRNLPLSHPINRAYEAATADIGDYNCPDHYHEKAYGISSVNYNRDVEAFELVKTIADRFVSPDNIIARYASPTDMGINTAGECIIDDAICREAALQEITRRKKRYEKMVQTNKGDIEAVERCKEILDITK